MFLFILPCSHGSIFFSFLDQNLQQSFSPQEASLHFIAFTLESNED